MSLDRTARVVLVLAALAVSACTTKAALMDFDDDFLGPGLDAAWNQAGDPAGHPAAISGAYDITDAQGAPGVKLSRSTPGALESYTHEIEVVLDPFLLSGSGGVQSDFKWKMFGPDGFMEFVFNSSGVMRLFHNDFSGGAGDIQPNTNIGYTDGDVLKLTTVYNQGTDTVDITYSLNAGAAVPYYSGGGIDGPIGDTISNFVEVEVFKFGSVPEEAIVSIDRWSLTSGVIPEPSGAVLLAILSLSVLGRTERQRSS